MNIPSIEIGWIITNKDSDDYEGPIFEGSEEDENGHFVPGTENHPHGTQPDSLYIETHPHNLKRVFVTWAHAEHGFDLSGIVEPRGVTHAAFKHQQNRRGLSTLVRDYIKELDPEAVVSFGVIETQR